jgi:hypothetical protein
VGHCTIEAKEAAPAKKAKQKNEKESFYSIIA